MESLRQTLFLLVDQYPQTVFFTGLGLLLIGLLWIVVLLFSILRRAIWPLLLMTLGLLVLVGPWVLTLSGWLKDTRPRERIVGGETVLTVTGADFDYQALKDRTDLDVLQMANPNVTDATLEYVATCTNLRKLDLSGTDITDAGLARIATLPLKQLYLQRTKISDAGFRQYILPMETLMELNLRATKVEKTTGAEWEKARKGRLLIQ